MASPPQLPPLLLLLLLLLALQWHATSASRSQIECKAEGSCTVSSWLGPWGDSAECSFAKAVFPTTEPELIQAVADAVREKRQVKVASGSLHSTPKLVCPGGSSGVLISTQHYDASFTIDATAKTVTLGAGLRLNVLLDGLAAAGLGLPNVPAWSTLSVVGAISTGAHGSSLWPDSGPLHDRVLAVRIVVPAPADRGYARSVTVTDSPALDAVRLSLGVLGAVSQITLRVEDLSKRALAFERASDEDIAARIVSLPREAEFGEIRWFPSQRQAIYRLESRVPLSTPGNATLHSLATAAGPSDTGAFSLFPMSPSSIQAGRRAQEAAEEAQDTATLCKLADAIVDSLAPAGLGAEVVGFSHGFQTTDSCRQADLGTEHVCHWDDEATLMHETSIAVPVSRIADFIADVEKLRDLRPGGLCGLGFYYGFLLRYVKGGSKALLGETEDAVDVNAMFLRSRQPWQPRLDEDVLEEIEQIALVKYGGKAHWGKSNRAVSFIGAAAKFGKRLLEFVEVKEQLDPDAIFSSPWSDAVLGLDESGLQQLRPFCALEGLCICRDHSHCAPDAGYFCRPGLVFAQARVCRLEAPALKEEL